MRTSLRGRTPPSRGVASGCSTSTRPGNTSGDKSVLAEVVEDVVVRPVEVRAVGVEPHRDPEQLRAMPTREEAAVGAEPTGVDPGDESTESRLRGERLACVQQLREPLRGVCARADCSELHVAGAADRKSTRLNSSHLGISY